MENILLKHVQSHAAKITLLRRQDGEVALFRFPQLCMPLSRALLPANGFSGWLWGFYFLLHLDVLVFHLN